MSEAQGALPLEHSKPLFAVLDMKEGELMFIVEAADAEEASFRANCVAPLFGWKFFEDGQLAAVDECPTGVPTFFDAFFGPLRPRASRVH